jgi:hypothetical protein
VQKNQVITSLITGGVAGKAADFAEMANCSEGHARNTLKWLVWKGLAQVERGIFRRYVYNLSA